MKRCLGRSSTPLPSTSEYQELKALRMPSNTTSTTSESSESSDSESRPRPPRKVERKSGMSLAAMNTMVNAKMRALDEGNDAIHAKKLELDKVLQKYKNRITQPCSKCKRMRKGNCLLVYRVYLGRIDKLETAESSKSATQEELKQYKYAEAAKKFKMVAKADASCQSALNDPELDAANAEKVRLQEELEKQYKQYDTSIWSMDRELQTLNRVKSNLEAQLAKFKHTGNEVNQTQKVTANASMQADLDPPKTIATLAQDLKLQAELSELRAKNEQLNAVISSMKVKNISLEGDLVIQKDISAKTTALKEELDKLKVDSSAEKSALIEEIAKMKAEVASMRQENSSLQSEKLNSNTEQAKSKAVANSGNASETRTNDRGSQSKLNGSKLDAAFAVKTALESELARSRAQLSSVTSVRILLENWPSLMWLFSLHLSSALKDKSSLESQLASHKARQSNTSDKETQIVVEHNDQDTQTSQIDDIRPTMIEAYSQVDIDDVLELRSNASAVICADVEPVNELIPISPEPLSPASPGPLSPAPSLRISLSETTTPVKDSAIKESSPIRSTPQSPISPPQEKVPEFSAIVPRNDSNRAKSVPSKPKPTKRKVVLTDPRLTPNPGQNTLKAAQKPISAMEVKHFEKSKNPVERNMPEFPFKPSVFQKPPSVKTQSTNTMENRKNETPAGTTLVTSTNAPVKRRRIVYNGDVPESSDRPLKQQKSEEVFGDETSLAQSSSLPQIACSIGSFLDWGRPRIKMDQVEKESQAISSLEEISSIRARVSNNTILPVGLDNPQTENSRSLAVEISTKRSDESSARRPRIVYNTNPDVKIGQSKKDVQKSEQNSNHEWSSSSLTSRPYRMSDRHFGLKPRQNSNEDASSISSSSSYSSGQKAISSKSKILPAKGEPWLNSSIASNIRFTPAPYSKRTSQSSSSAKTSQNAHSDNFNY
ncbi:hypothetical protein Ddc_16427 [Ditylenchus destructor]|nr:hypothetical protein Ddc_16427 [Ditylenchus destructor]